jgi:hypothetical protein
MKTTLRELQKDLTELKQNYILEKSSNAITEDDMYHFSCFLDDKNPRLGEILKETGDFLAINNLSGLVDGKIKLDIENPLHKKYIELNNEYEKLYIIEFEKWRGMLTDEEVDIRILTRNY